MLSKQKAAFYRKKYEDIEIESLEREIIVLQGMMDFVIGEAKSTYNEILSIAREIYINRVKNIEEKKYEEKYCSTNGTI